MTELCDWAARDLRAAIGTKTISPVELLDSCLGRVAAVNGAVNAIVTVDGNAARAAARAAEAAVMRGEPLGPLHGLPVGIKDSQDTAGLRTTYGSPLFAGHVPAADEGCVARLRAAGAVVLGKTNTPEWTAGANTRNPVHGATGNAFDPARSAAGSSGGSAVALACGMVPLASGSDTGGSLRNPAGYAGIVGLRPSPGLVGSGKRPFGWSNLATDGPMARDVGDCALMLSALAGDDPRDPLSYALPGEAVRGRPELWSPPRVPALKGLRLAFTEDFGFAPTERAVRRAFRLRAAVLAPLFARAEEATPDCAGADDSFAVLRASLFLGSFGDLYRERPDMLGRNVRVNVEEGLGYTLADHARAAAAQTRIARAFTDFFARHDVLVSPTLTLSPRPWSESFPAEIDGAPTRSYYHWLALAYAVTLAGCPALSLPMGRDEAGLPFGVQIVGPRGGDALVLGAAAAIEEACQGSADFGRPLPDLARLAAAPPIDAMPGFRDWV